MVDNAHVAFAATRLDQGASVSPEELIVFQIGICSCALVVVFSEFRLQLCGQYTSIGEFHVFSFSPDLLLQNSGVGSAQFNSLK